MSKTQSKSQGLEVTKRQGAVQGVKEGSAHHSDEGDLPLHRTGCRRSEN